MLAVPEAASLWDSLPNAEEVAADPAGFVTFALEQAQSKAQYFIGTLLVDYMQAVVTDVEKEAFRDFICTKILGRFELQRTVREDERHQFTGRR